MKSKSIPEIRNRSLIKSLKPDSESTLDFVDDLIEMAKSHDKIDLHDQLYKYRKPFLVKHAAQELFKVLVPYQFASFFRKRQKWRAEVREIDLQEYS